MCGYSTIFTKENINYQNSYDLWLKRSVEQFVSYNYYIINVMYYIYIINVFDCLAGYDYFVHWKIE